jgi:hypothetical protein
LASCWRSPRALVRRLARWEPGYPRPSRRRAFARWRSTPASDTRPQASCWKPCARRSPCLRLHLPTPRGRWNQWRPPVLPPRRRQAHRSPRMRPGRSPTPIASPSTGPSPEVQRSRLVRSGVREVGSSVGGGTFVRGAGPSGGGGRWGAGRWGERWSACRWGARRTGGAFGSAQGGLWPREPGAGGQEFGQHVREKERPAFEGPGPHVLVGVSLPVGCGRRTRGDVGRYRPSSGPCGALHSRGCGATCPQEPTQDAPRDARASRPD